MKRIRSVAGLIVLAAFLPACLAHAQGYSFGKNKVHYQSFEWLTLKGEHVEVFYYPEEEPLARIALIHAEESYADLAARFQHEVPRAIPVIIYSSHHHFEQTNVAPFFLPEGVQGFTEFSKGRVVLPYTGSFAEFRHVIHHEMVHVFQFSIVEETYKKHRKTSYLVPPLWFSEGLAEHWSSPWDAQGDMVLADLVLESHVPDIANLWRHEGTFTIYKLGQSLCTYIGDKYGQEALRRLYAEIWKEERFDRLLQRVTGVPARKLSEEWIYSLKRRYYPEVKDGSSIALVAEERAVSQGMNLKPVAVPDSVLLGGDRYLFLSARSGYTNIYMASAKGSERDVKSVVRGQRTAQFESFHPFQSRIDVSRRGELAFVSKWNERDAIFVMDLATKEIRVRRRVEDLISLSSPAWSPDGSRIAFSGQRASGQSDLFLLDPMSGDVRALTNDFYTDSDPAWSPDGSKIVFSSDRTRFGRDGHLNLFLLDTQTLGIRYLTCGPWKDQSPAWSPDGTRIAFASDRAGGWNLFAVDTLGTGARIARVLGAATDPAWMPDGKRLLFTGYRRGGFGVHEMRVPEAGIDSFTLAIAESPAIWGWEETLARSSGTPGRYTPRYGLDLVQGGVVIDPSEDAGQGLQGTVSDLLGNRIFHFTVGNTAQTSSEILSRMNAGVWFINLQNRWNYGLGAFHFAGDYQDVIGLRYFERRAGTSLLGSYPFSRFSRIEGTVQAYYDEKEREDGSLRTGFLTTHSVSLVRDNALWFATGPRDGGRYNVTTALTTNWSSGRTENVTVSADLRRYFRTGQYTSLAVRALGRLSSGDDPQRFAIGGSHSLRGYSRRSIFGTRVYLANAEYRFPLLDRLVLGVPLRGLELPGIEGAVFADAGNAWEKFEKLPRPMGSVGLGFRMNLGGYLVLRYDLAKHTDFKELEPDWHKEFYLGFDY
jgi:hypothetical protein